MSGIAYRLTCTCAGLAGGQKTYKIFIIAALRWFDWGQSPDFPVYCPSAWDFLGIFPQPILSILSALRASDWLSMTFT